MLSYEQDSTSTAAVGLVFTIFSIDQFIYLTTTW